MWVVSEGSRCYTQQLLYSAASQNITTTPSHSLFFPVNTSQSPCHSKIQKWCAKPGRQFTQTLLTVLPTNSTAYILPLTRRIQSHTPAQHHEKLIFMYFSVYVENSSLPVYTVVITGVISDVTKELVSFIFKGKQSKKQECQNRGGRQKNIYFNSTHRKTAEVKTEEKWSAFDKTTQVLYVSLQAPQHN